MQERFQFLQADQRDAADPAEVPTARRFFPGGTAQSKVTPWLKPRRPKGVLQ